MRRRTVFFILLSFLLYLIEGCKPSTRNVTTIRGSDTMVLIGQRWAEVYMEEFPHHIIQVNGGGSGVGFASLINGITDICQASRPIKKKEIDYLYKKWGNVPIEIPVAKDGIAIYVHQDNPLEDLSVKDLYEIYSGNLDNWMSLNGLDMPIVVYGRENSSGTYEFFKNNVLKGDDFAAHVQTLPGTAAIVSSISKDINSIGYGGVSYSKGIKLVPLKRYKNDTDTATIPTLETVSKSEYPISRDLYFYLEREPNEKEKLFIDWVLSEKGQHLAVKEGYFPIGDVKKDSNLTSDLNEVQKD